MLNESLLRQLFEVAVKRSGAFGAQLSIVKDNQQLDFASGFANAERGLAMNTDTLLQIGSITKVFNAVLVVSLVENGVLDLDEPIQAYVPRFEVGDPQAARTLTLRHLTSMSSGLDNGSYANFGHGEDALGQYVSHLKALPQHFPPGKYFGYSNAGSCIAGHVASLVTARPWEALLRARILGPAALNQSAILDEDVQGKLVSAGHYPSPYGDQLSIVEPMFTPFRARAPSGPSLAMTAGNLARFGKIFINKGVADTGTRILSESSVDRMLSPQIDVPNRIFGTAWCIGPYMGSWHGIRMWGHGGSTTTSASHLLWIPERQGVMAFIINTHSAMGEFSRFAFDQMLKAAFELSKPSVYTPEVPITPVDYRRYVGTYDELGMRMYVSRGEKNSLRARFVPNPIGQELGISRSEQSVILTPLGGDRFLVEPPDGPDRWRGVVDTAFFGDDGEGRASNVLNLVFPMHRVDA